MKQEFGYQLSAKAKCYPNDIYNPLLSNVWSYVKF
ncbi:hypothetical protein BH10CHL1_BH10CHL1_02750 [soil metagenome]